MLLPRLIGPGRRCSLPADFILLSLIFWVCTLCKLGGPFRLFGSKPERGLPWRRIYYFISWDAGELPSRDQRPGSFHQALWQTQPIQSSSAQQPDAGVCISCVGRMQKGQKQFSINRRRRHTGFNPPPLTFLLPPVTDTVQRGDGDSGLDIVSAFDWYVHLEN